MIADLGVLGFVCYMLAVKGQPSKDVEGMLFAFLFLAVPILNLVALYTSKEGKGWLSLYLQRKRLEEKRRIEALNRQDTV